MYVDPPRLVTAGLWAGHASGFKAHPPSGKDKVCWVLSSDRVHWPAGQPPSLQWLGGRGHRRHRPWFAPVPSCNSGVTVPANNLVLKEDDERAWPPSDPLVWKITELHACCSHVGALCAGRKTTLIARLQGTPDPRTSALVAASLDTLDATNMTNTSSSTPTVPLEAATTTSSLHTTTVPATEPTGTTPPPS